MSTVQVVTKVWIAPGCIVCDACETTAPTVFEVKHDDGTCIIRPAALDAEFCKPLTPDIVQAAEECPVDVIKFDRVEVPADQAPKFAAAAPAAEAADKATPHAPAAGEPAPAAAPGAKASPAKPHKPAEKPKSTDPAIAALLDAATFRGGAATLLRNAAEIPAAVQQLQKGSPDQLPPDARYAKVIEQSKPAKPGAATRRDFMLATGWAAIAVSGAGSLMAFQRFMMPNVLEEPEPRVRCGPLARFVEMQPGDVNEDFKNSGRFWIIREDERIAAVSIVCTHLGCIPNWLPNDRKFKCPCHGSGFKPTGVNFEGPAPRPLERFKILVDGGEVVVDRSKKFLAMGPNDTAVWNDPDASISV